MNFVKFTLSTATDPQDIWNVIRYEIKQFQEEINSYPSCSISEKYLNAIYFKKDDPDQTTQNFIKFLQDNKIGREEKYNICFSLKDFDHEIIGIYNIIGTEVEYDIIKNMMDLFLNYKINVHLSLPGDIDDNYKLFGC